ncbi:hypothetical protein YC2023_030571 [Brassica napus]
MRLRPRGLNRVEWSSVSDQFAHLGLDRVIRFEHDESSGWIFSIRSMQPVIYTNCPGIVTVSR